MTGNGRTGDQEAARAMLDAFTSVGAESFNVTWTNRKGDKTGYRKEMPAPTLRHLLPAMLEGAVKEEKNLIVRPLSRRAVFIQLDDLDAAKAIAMQLGGLKGNKDAIAETIENNVRRKIIKEHLNEGSVAVCAKVPSL
jgi:hypothetical protein